MQFLDININIKIAGCFNPSLLAKRLNSLSQVYSVVETVVDTTTVKLAHNIMYYELKLCIGKSIVVSVHLTVCMHFKILLGFGRTTVSQHFYSLHIHVIG